MLSLIKLPELIEWRFKKIYQFTKQVKLIHIVALGEGQMVARGIRGLLGVGSISFHDVGTGPRGAPCVQIFLTINLRCALSVSFKWMFKKKQTEIHIP